MNNRVSTSHQFSGYSANIQTAMHRMSALQQQIITGKKFDNLRDDPLGAATVLSASSLQSRYGQFDANLRVAREYLGQTDTAMASVSNLLGEANTLALQGANGTIDATTRSAMAQQVKELQTRLVYVGNTQGSGDKYLFAGQSSKTKPFTVAPGDLTFNGDDNPVQVEVRPGEKMAVNLVIGSKVFTDTYSKLEKLRTNLESGDTSLLQASISDIKAITDSVISLRGDAGTKMQTVNRLSDDNRRRIDDLTKQISDVQDADIAETLTKYKSAEVGYQASLQVLAQGNKYSLLDFLR